MSKERVKKHRDALKEKGYKQINVMISEEAYEKLKVAQIRNDKNFSEMIELFIIKDKILCKKDSIFFSNLKNNEKSVTSNKINKKVDK